MTMFCKEALTAFIRHLALASGVTLLLLMGLEWLMPGAVLPFVDVFDLLLPISVLLLIVLAREATSSKLLRWLQMMLVILVSVVLLAILATRMENYSPAGYLLMAAFAICIITWALATAKPNN